MNLLPDKSFAEVLSLMQRAEFVAMVATGVVLLFYQVPAYRRWRTRALLLIVIGEMLGLFITVHGQTFGQHGPPDSEDWWAYWWAGEVVWFASVIITTVGALMFLRDYGRLAATREGASQPPPTTETR